MRDMVNVNAEQEAINHGREAWQRLKTDQTFEDWMLVGQALEIGYSWATRRANAPSGKGYNLAIKDWLADNGFGDIDRGTRSRLRDIMEHRVEIETWRQKLHLTERLRKNHPNSIWRGWEADKKKDGLPTTADEKKATSEPRKRRGGQASEIDEATARLHATFDDIERRLAPGAEFFDMTPEHIHGSAINFVEIFGAEDTRRFIAELQAIVAPAPEPEPVADPAFAQSLTQPRRRKSRGIKPLDDPSRPRNRTKFKSGSGLNVQIRWPNEKA